MTTRAENVPASWTLPEVGDVVAGKYRLLEVLGKGGLAIVFGAMHETLGERVAVKMLLPSWSQQGEIVQRFLREGRSAIRIRGEHVVRVLDVDTTQDGAPYIVLEYLVGSDLEQLVTRRGPLPVDKAVEYVLQACEAMAEAHAAGIVHRDLKPANLFLTQAPDGSDCVKVLDFGISKNMQPRGSELDLTSPSIVMGSPHYMSPEQLTSTASVDERSDIWSLGAILYELLAGRPPFEGETGPQICVNVMQVTPPPLTEQRPDVPEALEATVFLCLEKEPAKRFSNVGELALALAAFGPPDTAHASADKTVRVLQAAGIIPTTTSGLWISPSGGGGGGPITGRTSGRPRHSSSQAAVRAAAASAGVGKDTLRAMHLKSRRPTIIVAALFAGLALGVGGVFVYWMHEVDGRAFLPTAEEPNPSPTRRSAAAPATTAPPAETQSAAPAPPPPKPTASVAAEEPKQTTTGDPTQPRTAQEKPQPEKRTKTTTRAYRPPPPPRAAPPPAPPPPAPKVTTPVPTDTSGINPAVAAPPPDAPIVGTATPSSTSTATSTPPPPPPPPAPTDLFDERK